MSDPDPEADVINALEHLLLQSGVQGGESNSSFFVPASTYLFPVDSTLRQFEARVQARFPNQNISFPR